MSTPVTPPLVGPSLALSEELTYSTVRIVCTRADNSESMGTGFIFAFLRNGNDSIPAIVTNKHVVDGAVTASFVFTRTDTTGAAIPRGHIQIRLERVQDQRIDHPADDVDLCVLPIAPILHLAQEQQHRLLFRMLDERLLPSPAERANLVALEDVVMIGYPIGLWDSVNNMPILRRGITATHPNFDYESRQEFMIDAACFPGSSGSPVLLYSSGVRADRQGNMALGSPQTKLLGILYAGPQTTATGEIRIVNVPTQQRAIAVSSIPTNLGLVIKSSRLRDFEPLLRARFGGPGPAPSGATPQTG